MRAWRKARGLKKKEFADMLGIGLTTLSYLEKGERNPGLALGLTIQLVTSISPTLWPKPKKRGGRAA